MTRTRTIFVLLLAATLLLGGCFNRERDPVYVSSEEISPIEAPPGLDQPATRDTYDVPGYSLPELAAQGQQERPPEVQPSSVAERSRSQIRFGRKGLYLAVEDQPDSVWRRLGFSLDRGEMQLRQIDETERRYRFSFSHEPIRPDMGFFDRITFWSRPEAIDYSGEYVARVASEAEGGVTRVELLDDDGDVVEMDRAEFVLARLRERLG
ncbi:hypothetical protein [Wenzhouxiangella sp. EGI_FJ10409]|uniref:hypothetical protein n=1 Tax=Wenzhouxiangella sp. EGI_FJ10409 TaxID=3243767 RepID=UPI0035D5C888